MRDIELKFYMHNTLYIMIVLLDKLAIEAIVFEEGNVIKEYNIKDDGPARMHNFMMISLTAYPDDTITSKEFIKALEKTIPHHDDCECKENVKKAIFEHENANMVAGLNQLSNVTMSKNRQYGVDGPTRIARKS